MAACSPQRARRNFENEPCFCDQGSWLFGACSGPESSTVCDAQRLWPADGDVAAPELRSEALLVATHYRLKPEGGLAPCQTPYHQQCDVNYREIRRDR